MRRLMLLGMVVAVVFAGCGGDDKPTSPTPTGSCCDARSAYCEIKILMDCTDSAVLTWTEGGVCSPNPCPPPTGACCTPAGTCTVTTQAACLGQQRTWIPYSFCSPNPCPPPTSGACCTPAGTCTVTTRAACGGTWTTGGVCTPNPCVQPTGSCCAPAGTCTVTMQANCTGTWTAAGVCAPNPCTPNPPTGMVWIPAGNVRLGQDGIAEPVNDFNVAGFYIDIYEVSNAEYKTFIDAGGYTTEAYWNPVGWAWRVSNGIMLPNFWSNSTRHGGGIAGMGQFPVNGVSWFEADAYCRWAGKRLPTEAEWEKAAKGGCETHGDPGQCDASDTPTYPWGEGITGPQANCVESGDPYDHDGAGYGSTTPVGYYDGSNHGGYQTINSPSPYGLYDVAGNVLEWCSTKRADYPYAPNDGRENPPVFYDECCRVLHGGSYGLSGFILQSAYRYYYDPRTRGDSVGFRCVRTGS